MESKRKNSEKWNHFQVVEGNKDKTNCNYCSSLIAISKSSTGNLTRHMRTKHIGIPIYREKNITAFEPADKNNSELKPDEPIKNTPGPYSASASHNPANKKPNIQGYMDNFVVNVKPVPINKSKQFDKQLLRIIVKEYQLFSIVEDVEFKKFVSMLCPGYTLPSRKCVSDTLLPQTYNKVRNDVKQNISKAYAVCITTDSWTSVSNDNFISITAHWLDDTNQILKLHSNLLDCVIYSQRHTAENLCGFLQEKIEEWGIQNQVVVAVSDNAPNIVAAIRNVNWLHIGCFAHTVNLIVQKALQNIEELLVKIRKVVEFFKRSSQALAKLKQTQEQMNLPILKLKMDVCTRWNSTLDMVDRFYQRKEAIISTLAILQHDINLNATDWEVIKHVITILTVFNDVTNEISAEQNVAISKIFVFLSAMENHIRYCKTTILLELLQPMMDVFLDEIAKRSKIYKKNELIQQATLLDPRFKKYGFTDPNYL